MNNFPFTYPTKVYFGEGAAADALKQELPKVGKTVMLAYGGGSLKKSGVYDELKDILEQAEAVSLTAVKSFLSRLWQRKISGTWNTEKDNFRQRESLWEPL